MVVKAYQNICNNCVRNLDDVLYENKDKPKVVILDDNELSMAKYAEEYPENFKEISDADHESKDDNNVEEVSK